MFIQLFRQNQTYFVIVGFRFMFSQSSGIGLLSSVRCSLLVGQISDVTDCILLDFNLQAKDSHNWNETWTHECPDGYGLTAVYDDNEFKSIKKAKCCRMKGTSYLYLTMLDKIAYLNLSIKSTVKRGFKISKYHVPRRVVIVVTQRLHCPERNKGRKMCLLR